jgi:hypothetical protein
MVKELLRKKIFLNWLTPTTITIAVCFIYVMGVLINSGGSPMACVLLGSRFSQNNPQGSEGYDGQFAYQIALNPLQAAPYLDAPAYRYQRILYPLLTRGLAFGQPDLIPWALIIVNIAAIGVGTWVTGLLLIEFKVSRWYALVYGLYGGQLLALRTDLNEPLAHCLVMVAIWTWARDRRWTIVAFSLAALAKETSLIFLVAYGLYTFHQRQWRWTAVLATAGAPFLAYQLLLWQWFGSFGVGSGGANATPFSLIPLGGWLTIATVHIGAFLLISLIVAPMSILPSLAGIWLSLCRLRQGQIHPLVYCLLLNSLVILFLPASTFREPAAMVRLTQGLAISMLLFGAFIRSPRILNYCTLWIAANVLLIKGPPTP